MLELGHGFRVVDVHTRLDPVGGSERGRDIEPERLERELHQAGIVKAVVSPGPRDRGYLAANNAVARLSVERPFVAFARLDGPRHPTSRLRSLGASRAEHHVSPEDVEQFAYDDRFAGFTLAPVVDGLPERAVLETLGEVGLPVVVHGGRGFPPERVAETLLDHRFPVVLAGFGGYPLDRAQMTRAIDLLDAYDELYLDTAAVRFRDLLERAIKEHPDRVLFGSGAPDVHPNVAVMELLTCSVPEDEMKRVFDANPSRVVSALAP
ncbi:amidohydrolase family protein [Halorarius litoreus]|uniref:amidohydrolase family protein n=1 Tax=Halorarius litoreus TaxID=2962676 RepID=UPI0020CE1FAF|nr:amidohydrolase family protein [Halorarius litoreus]